MPESADSRIVLTDLTVQHARSARALSEAVGWPHRTEDWEMMLALGQGLGAIRDGVLVGTIGWWPIGEFAASLGMVIVSPDTQRQGLGARLMQAALERIGEDRVVLNATTEGLDLYRRFGFVETGRLRQRQGPGPFIPASAPSGEVRVRDLDANDIAAAISLDSQATGMKRGEILMTLWRRGAGVIAERNDQPIGFALTREFGRGRVIGPVAAEDDDVAKRLISVCMEKHPSVFLRIDTGGTDPLSDWLDARGLRHVDGVVTMESGHAQHETATRMRAYAAASQAFG